MCQLIDNYYVYLEKPKRIAWVREKNNTYCEDTREDTTTSLLLFIEDSKDIFTIANLYCTLLHTQRK